ncbi:MAG: hypothetical protein LBD42_06645 [Desulfovibrio sp.]|jgi:hypothetical protein|nr:hypothetical protein [Desulfovibrio sp.]
MTIDWKHLFTRAAPAWQDAWTLAAPLRLATLASLHHFLDLAHIKYGLVKPYSELSDYPIVGTRELLPSFESDLWEHKKLPGFSLVAFARPIEYFQEIFQFEFLTPIDPHVRVDRAQSYMLKNMGTLLSRMPRGLHDHLRLQFQKQDIGDLMNYSLLTPFLFTMDRGQVMGLHGPHPQDMSFYLAGVYASFPMDLDTEVKRYGLRIGKFALDDDESYERNRNFVLQHLMELYGYPIASERRTSAALFARRLHKMGERFLVRTLGQSDRTLTTIWSDGGHQPYPRVEKIALVSIEDIHDGMLERLAREGYFIDEKKRVLILRVSYKQHAFSQDNVRQERALSVAMQAVIHPLTGEALNGVNLIRDTTTMILRLNDIVRGEHTDRIVYKRNEIVENTNTEEKRLKFLYAWMSKHQRRMIGYSDEFFTNIDKVLNLYLFSPDRYERFAEVHELHQEVVAKYSYIHQARKVRVLEDLYERNFQGERIGYARMLFEAATLLHSLKFEIASYFDSLVTTVISLGEAMLNDRYLLRKYIEKSDERLTQNGLEIKKAYGKLVALIDDFKAIRKSRIDSASETGTQ